MAKVKHKEDPWVDRPKQHRPTKERLKRGSFVLSNTSRDGIKAAVDLDATPVSKAVRRKKLSVRQGRAAEGFEKLYVSVWSRGGSRDSLDLSPRAGQSHESPEQALWIAHSKQRLERLQFSMNAKTARVLFEVCVRHEPIGHCRVTSKRYQHLVLGLDVCADFLNM